MGIVLVAEAGRVLEDALGFEAGGREVLPLDGMLVAGDRAVGVRTPRPRSGCSWAWHGLNRSRANQRAAGRLSSVGTQVPKKWGDTYLRPNPGT